MSEKRERGATGQLLVIGFLVVAMCMYFVLIGRYAVAVIAGGGVANIALGLALLVLPVLGAWMIYSTLRAGFAHQRLVAQARERGRDLDVSQLPKMPSGRVDRASADALFADVKAEFDADPDDWVVNYRLARAYDYAGDRKRARAIMGRAVELEKLARKPS